MWLFFTLCILQLFHDQFFYGHKCTVTMLIPMHRIVFFSKSFVGWNLLNWMWHVLYISWPEYTAVHRNTLWRTRHEMRVQHNIQARSCNGFLLQWQINKYYIFWVCVCSIRYSARNAHAPYCHLWPAQLYHIIYTLSNIWHSFRKRVYWV